MVAPSALLDDRAEEKITEIGRKLKVLVDGKSSRIGGEAALRFSAESVRKRKRKR